MKELNLIMDFITAARAIAEFSDDSHFELTFTTPKGGEQVIKVDVLSADDTTELEDKHWSECRQIAHYDDESKQFADIGKMYSEIKSEAINKFAESLRSELKNLSKVNLFGNTFALVSETFVERFVKKYEGENNDI